MAPKKRCSAPKPAAKVIPIRRSSSAQARAKKEASVAPARKTAAKQVKASPAAGAAAASKRKVPSTKQSARVALPSTAVARAVPPPAPASSSTGGCSRGKRNNRVNARNSLDEARVVAHNFLAAKNAVLEAEKAKKQRKQEEIQRERKAEEERKKKVAEEAAARAAAVAARRLEKQRGMEVSVSLGELLARQIHALVAQRCEALDADSIRVHRHRMTTAYSRHDRACFLADVENHLWRSMCRLLPSLTTRTSRAFVSIAMNGRTPLSSPAVSSSDEDDDEAGTGKPGGGGDDVLRQLLRSKKKRDPDAGHEEAYHTVRDTIAASCALGHRSCQVLWGPRGSGKHRIMRLVAEECRKMPNTLVLELNGGLLKGDEGAIRAIAQQMLDFLKSPRSATLRARDWSIATGTFDFGRLFHFEKHLSQVERGPHEENVTGGASYRTSNVNVNNKSKALKSQGAADSANMARKRRRGDGFDDGDEDDAVGDRGGGGTRRKHTRTAVSDSDTDADEGEAMLISFTTAYLKGGASSALSPLQRALLAMKSSGTNIVVCIRQVDQFGIACDQLLYVLSGLMHEGDGGGGGMTLLLSSGTPDVRQLEKRLSSRLTCETRFVPMLNWTVRRVVRAVVTAVRDEARRALGAVLAEGARSEREEKAAAAAHGGGGHNEAAGEKMSTRKKSQGKKVSNARGGGKAVEEEEEDSSATGAVTAELEATLAAMAVTTASMNACRCVGTALDGSVRLARCR